MSENSRPNNASDDTSELKILAICNADAPIPLLKLQSIIECSSVSSVSWLQRLQELNDSMLSLCKPFFVISKPCNNFKLKDANTLSIPSSLHNLHIFSQSDCGEINSARHGMKLPSNPTVRPSSVYALVHSLILIFLMSKLFSYKNFLMVRKKSIE